MRHSASMGLKTHRGVLFYVWNVTNVSVIYPVDILRVCVSEAFKPIELFHYKPIETMPIDYVN